MGFQLPGQEGGEGGEPQPLNLESCLDCCLGSHRAVSLFLPFLFPSQVLGMGLGGLDSALEDRLGVERYDYQQGTTYLLCTVTPGSIPGTLCSSLEYHQDDA